MLLCPVTHQTAAKGPLEDCGAEREPVPCNPSQDKPLIAVKPQPHVALEVTPGRAAVPAMPGFGVPYGVSPPMVSPPYLGLPLGQYPCHLPAHGASPVFHGDQILPLDAYGRRWVLLVHWKRGSGAVNRASCFTMKLEEGVKKDWHLTG